MSPNTYFDNDFELKERETIVIDIRSSYSFIFNQIVQIYKIHHQYEKLSSKAEEVVNAVEKLHNEGNFNDYLYENFQSCYVQYPTMLVSNLVEEKEKVGSEKQFERLNKLKGLLKIYIGELSEEINDLVDQEYDSDMKEIVRKYFK